MLNNAKIIHKLHEVFLKVLLNAIVQVATVTRLAVWQQAGLMRHVRLKRRSSVEITYKIIISAIFI